MDELVALAIVAAFAIGRVRGGRADRLLHAAQRAGRDANGPGSPGLDRVADPPDPDTANLLEQDGKRTRGQGQRAEGRATSSASGRATTSRPTARSTSGLSSVNEATITGESLPVDKVPGMQVFAGTSNLTGALDIRVTKAGEDTTLGKVQSLILQAEQTKIPIMRIIDRYVQWYMPTILMIAAIVWFFTRNIDQAITMLVISCPCALILATPTAMVAALSAAARLGILVKNVVDLEVGREDDGRRVRQDRHADHRPAVRDEADARRRRRPGGPAGGRGGGRADEQAPGGPGPAWRWRRRPT